MGALSCVIVNTIHTDGFSMVIDFKAMAEAQVNDPDFHSSVELIPAAAADSPCSFR